MLKTTLLLLLLAVAVLTAGTNPQTIGACPCRNGGVCLTSYFDSSCQCPTQYIGRYCETKARVLEGTPEYAAYDYNFTHFVFAPEAPNLFKFTFQACMLHNPLDLETLIFVTSDQDDGSPSYDPTIFSSAKIKVKEETCQTFTSPYIQIRHNVKKPFCRIIIAFKAISKSFRNIFYRTVPGKNLRPLPQEILDQQPFYNKEFTQKIYISFTYEIYRETLTETAVRLFVRILIGSGISLALFLFCKIALFSYGIHTKDILLYVTRSLRSIWRKLCPDRNNEKTYRNYLRFRAGAREEGEALRGEDCAICLQPFELSDIIQQTKCKHIYHQTCLQEWWQKNEICPLCRQQLTKNNESWQPNGNSDKI